MLGIYEKALPKDISWFERLTLAKELGFDFVEMSVDETDERIARLDWTKVERKKVRDAIFELDMPILSISQVNSKIVKAASFSPLAV